MADVIRKATNKFTKGLVMDFSPENTRNEVLIHALNATLLTFNGNELSLQNDMGNARVETAYLPNGYMPVGTCEYGGIIYIVSYNPLENKSQIGCFPSPERNISQKELGHNTEIIGSDKFTNGSGEIHNNSYKVLLKQSNLNPGDKFLIHSNPELVKNRLKDLLIKKDDTYKEIDNPIIALNVVSIEDSGKIVYLNNTVHRYDFNIDTTQYKYFITPNADSNGNLIDLDSYRNALSSGYSVFKEKTSGKLAILAELITIDSYSVTHSIQQTENPGVFDIILHTEVSPELTSDTYYQNPKLAYYYLEESEGYLQVDNDSGNTIKMSDSGFMNTKLSSIYEPTDNNFSLELNPTLAQEGALFDFPVKGTYHRKEKLLSEDDLNAIDFENVNTQFKSDVYHRVKKSQLKNLDYFIQNLKAKFYSYLNNTDIYTQYEEEILNENYIYYIETIVPKYIDVERNIEFKDQTLYKRESLLQIADSTVIADISIEKFENEEIEIYKKATDEDIENNDTFYQKIADNQYKKVSKPLDPNITYYIKQIKITKKSLGYDLTNQTIPSTVYYYSNTGTPDKATPDDINTYFDFETYPEKAPFDLYRRTENVGYVEASEEDFESYQQGNTKLYVKNGYYTIDINETDPNDMVFVKIEKDSYLSNDYFVPEIDFNYITYYNTPDKIYPLERALSLYIVEQYLPELPIQDYVDYPYKDVKLATLKLPSVVSDNNLSFPFKYDYTIVPCMEFGKLNNLKVSNTIDFSKLYLFNQSEFDEWRYIVNGDQLIFTIGAQVYDTFETHKVDGIVLEFYDNQGCVGLIDILNKKSYSGQFTKSIYLNTKEELKSKYIKFTDGSVYGQYEDVPKRKEGYQEGILQSNLIYLVQPYLRVTEGNSYKFIKKNKLFLFTLPIFNDYYYTVRNFNTIEKPKLNMVLTYQISDRSKLKAVNFDNEKVQDYLSGKSDKTPIDFTSNVCYEGESRLQLAVGLHKDYVESGLLSDVTIGEIFNCKLNIEPINDQHITFEKGEGEEKTTLEIPNFNDYNFNDYNFLIQQENYINILYNFNVPYITHINNIKDTSVPATTICALYHQQPNGIYNYADFGLYEVSNEDVKCYLSDLVMYNSGSTTESIFGIARMAIASDSDQMYLQCTSYRQYTQDVISLTTPGRLNAGDPLKSVVNNIGKLSFCQPHAHCLLEGSYLSNIVKNSDGTYILDSESLTSNIIEFPIYNLSANTIDLIDYQTKFVSAVNYKEVSTSAEYNGLTLSQITKFNRLLLNSMSTIYAYNPDYKQVQLKIGEVVIDNPEQTFSSILYCNDSKFNFEENNSCLNDYLKLVKDDQSSNLSAYLKSLFQNYDESDYDKEQFPQLYFEPDYTYCGKEDKPYLISELTYNIKVPDKLYEDLSFDFSKGLFIKHSDSSWDYLEGDINRNFLYGFLQQGDKKKLVQLDVTTYTLDNDGFVKIKDKIKSGDTETVTIPSNIFPNEIGSVQNNFTATVDLNLENNSDSECTVTWTIPTLEYIQKIDDWIYGFVDLRNIQISQLTASYMITSTSETDNTNVWVTSKPKIEVVLVQNIPNSNSIVLKEIKDPNDLKWFFGEDPSGRNLTLNNGETISYGANCVSGGVFESTMLQTGYKTSVIFNFDVDANMVFGIVRCKVEDVNINVSIYKKLSDLEDTIIHVNKTNNYFIRNSNRYYNRYVDTNFKGSTITINDLIYRPEIDGHRLYMKDQYNVVSGAKIVYRLQGENLKDLSLNTLQLYSGPCYTDLSVEEKDPEYDLTTFNK